MVKDAVCNWLDTNNPDRSQNKLAEASRVNAAYISQIKQGLFTMGHGRDNDSAIGDQHFHKLADFLDVKFDGGLFWPQLRNFNRMIGPDGRCEQSPIHVGASRRNQPIELFLGKAVTPSMSK